MRIVRLFAIVLLSTSVAACPGKGKKQDTTAGGGKGTGGSDAVGMGGGDANGDGIPDGPGNGTTTGTGTGGDGTGTGTGGDGTGTGGDGTGTGTGTGGDSEPIIPKVVPPNLDPDPDEARASVQKHVRAGRDLLKGDKPDPDGAIREAKAALAIDGTSVDAVVVLAHAYYHKKLYDTAETILDMLVKDREQAKKTAAVYYVYGLVYDKTNEPAKAFKAYQTAVQLKPDYGSALVNLGVHQLRNKQYDEAMETYQRLTTDLGYNDEVSYSNLGSAYRGKAADYDAGSNAQGEWLLKAERAYKQATTANKNYGLAYYNLGLLYLDANPFPDGSGGELDTLVRLNKAKTYFEEYKNMPGVDIKLFDERMKNVDKLIKREEKKRKAKAREAAESN